MSITKPNRKEAEQATGIKIVDKETALQAAQSLRKLWGADVVLLSLGESGLLIVSPQHEEGMFRETVARQVFDVSGAGDTITALFTAATCVGASHELAGDFANIGAGVVVSEVGTAAVDAEKLRNEILLLAPAE
jgi:bifunctional ADP-heptose synthase (sugar kinase/adenylyltransferase)